MVLTRVNRLFSTGTDPTLMIGSFGASAVRVHGTVRSRPTQPRNLVGGHVVTFPRWIQPLVCSSPACSRNASTACHSTSLSASRGNTM
jgi:hypothetical protein